MNPELCPICGKKYKVRCRCFKGDSVCPNGHEWHRCLEHQVIVLGGSDHSKPTMDCSCGDNQTWPIDDRDEEALKLKQEQKEARQNDLKEWEKLFSGMGYARVEDDNPFAVFKREDNEVRVRL